MKQQKTIREMLKELSDKTRQSVLDDIKNTKDKDLKHFKQMKYDLDEVVYKAWLFSTLYGYDMDFTFSVKEPIESPYNLSQ